MSEIAKCPICGKAPVKMVFGAGWAKDGYKCCGHSVDTIVQWNQYAAAMKAEARHNALVEAVAWLREVDDTREWLSEFPWLRKWSGLDQCMNEARAEVDRLLTKEKP